MAALRADSAPLYKPMNSLAEKGVFRFAEMRGDGKTDERGPHRENLFSFQVAAPRFEAAVLFGQTGASVSWGMTPRIRASGQFRSRHIKSSSGLIRGIPDKEAS